jgi:hypothetical protein
LNKINDSIILDLNYIKHFKKTMLKHFMLEIVYNTYFRN